MEIVDSLPVRALPFVKKTKRFYGKPRQLYGIKQTYLVKDFDIDKAIDESVRESLRQIIKEEYTNILKEEKGESYYYEQIVKILTKYKVSTADTNVIRNHINDIWRLGARNGFQR